MIAYLKGKVINTGPNFLILENQGIGYKVLVPSEYLVTESGKTLEFYIHTKTADDGQTLFGMTDFDTLLFFELLLAVNGVGPKVALAIISSSKIEVLKQAIASGQTETFTQISGVGKKTAERIILELQNKIDLVEGYVSNGHNELFSALSALGYNPREIREVMQQIPTDNTTTEVSIKQALQLLSKK